MRVSESAPPGKRMGYASSGSVIGQGDVYHIFAAKRHGQDRTLFRKYKATAFAASNPECLIEPAAAIFTGIGGVDQQVDLPLARSRFDPFGPVQQGPRTRFHAEAIKRGLTKGSFGPGAKIRGDIERCGFKRAGQGALELALCISLVEFSARHGNPRPAAWSLGADVRRNLPVGAERKPDQAVARPLAAGEDAGAFWVAVPRRRGSPQSTTLRRPRWPGSRSA